MTHDVKPSSLGQLYLEKRYAQNPVLSAWGFERHCRDRGVDISTERLEFLEREGLVRPLLRVKRIRIPYKRVVREEDGQAKEYLVPLVEGEDVAAATDHRYGAVSSDLISLQAMREQGLVEFPDEVPFRPWSDYKDGWEETAFAYYHPFQVLMVKATEWAGSISFTDTILDAPPEEAVKRIVEGRKRREMSLQITTGQVKGNEKLIRLLMTIEDAILPDLRHVFASVDPRKSVDNQLADWLGWRRGIDWKALLAARGYTTEEIKDLYTQWSVYAQSLDPMDDWYLLIQNIPYEKRRSSRAMLD